MNLAMQARLTIVLAAACGLFGLLSVLFALGVGSGYRFAKAPADTGRPLPSIDTIKNQEFDMPEFAHFAEISQRPLFTDDRQPLPPDLAGDVEDNAAPVAPPVPLQVKLTGVILTPDLKMALLKDNSNNKDISLKEGMPLPGEQAAWQLVEVSPRKAVFKNDQDETSELELTVSDASGPPMRPSATRPNVPAAPSPNPVRGAAEAATNTATNGAQRTQSDAQRTLRERIEARREQLRAQAQRLREDESDSRQEKQEPSR